MELPFSQACENNREPIRQVIASYLSGHTRLLEIGSGTGQHGAYIAAQHPEIQWYPSDRAENLAGINAWVNYTGRDNFYPPVELDINNPHWAGENVDAIFSANTAHIMHWHEVENMFDFVGRALNAEGHFMLYGPFNYNGRFTSDSNAQFHHWLQAQAPHRGIRDFDKIAALATAQQLVLKKDHEMPANNRLLVWQRSF